MNNSKRIEVEVPHDADETAIRNAIVGAAPKARITTRRPADSAGSDRRPTDPLRESDPIEEDLIEYGELLD